LRNINKFFGKPATASTDPTISSRTAANHPDANRLTDARKDVTRVIGRLGPCSVSGENLTVKQAKAASRTAEVYEVCYVSQL
jgi:hypothetical protein